MCNDCDSSDRLIHLKSDLVLCYLCACKRYTQAVVDMLLA